MKLNVFKLIFIFQIILILCYMNCSSEPEYDRVKKLIEKNKLTFDKMGELFYLQKNIEGICFRSKKEFSINSDIVKFIEFDYTDLAIRKDNFQIKVSLCGNPNNVLTTEFRWLEERNNITKEEFHIWADFLSKYKLDSIQKYREIIKIVYSGGFIGESSGLIYIPNGSEELLSKYYPNKSKQFDIVQKIDKRWLYYVDY